MIVISDMMGTLTTGSPVLGIVDWIRYNQSKTQARWLMAKIMPGYLLAKSGLIDAQLWKQNLMIESLTWIHAVDLEKFATIADWTVEHNLWRKRRVDVIAILINHIQSGATVYIASSVYEPVTQSFARRLEAQAIGTPLQYDSGRIYFASGLVASEKKIQEVLRRLDVSRVDYAYGDTFMDIPLLEHADNPVAVYPDKQLYVTAKERGWKIFGEPQ